MSKILLINGSPNQRGCTFTALREISLELAKEGVESEILWLGKEPIADCIACGKCAEAGQCVFDDLVNRIASRLDEFDGVVAGSPVYYGGPSARICAFLDRLFYSNGARMAGKLGAAVVSCRRGGSTAAFNRLNMYFMMNNMVVPTSQYWNQVHGNTPEEVRQDREGLQTMRMLARNMAWLLRCIELGRIAGLSAPVPEPRDRTNFIR